MNWRRLWAIARTDLRQLRQSPDFWAPMVILAAVFFVVIPTILLLGITRLGDVPTVQKVSTALDLLPATARGAVQGHSAADRTSYALAVYLFAERESFTTFVRRVEKRRLEAGEWRRVGED